MTNAQIIFNHSVKLVQDGIIKGTGRFFTMETDDGEKIQIPEPEPLHTFAIWKQMGRQVKKGEHAKTQIQIWKQGKGKTVKNEQTGEDEEKEGRMFMKVAYFFTFDQTEAVKA